MKGSMNIQIGESCADAELIRFGVEDGKCHILVELWNARTVRLVIDDPLEINYKTFRDISEITQEPFNASNREDRSLKAQYYLYRFFNNDDEVCLKLIGATLVHTFIGHAIDDIADRYWIFNTNETNLPGAYRRMFARNVAAIYGYPSGPRKLQQGARVGDRIFAYVNRQGLRAVGTVVQEEVVPGAGIFVDNSGEQRPNEFHLKVRWEFLVPEELALSAAQARTLGYPLPVRETFARLRKSGEAAVLERELQKLSSL